MQASRLLKILMLLQSRGRLSAPALAAELEVSVRTVLRDMDQLSAAGVPVWGQRGRDGGFELQPGWSTELTGMTEAEAQALWLAGLPQAAAELGLGAAAASARLKLVAGLPAAQRGASHRVAQRLHLDPLDWYRAPDQPRFLREVAQAVWEGRRLSVRYQSWEGELRRRLDPLGLVLKAGAWYLVAAHGGTARTYRLASLLALRVLDELAERPVGFDLAAFWRESAARFEASLRGYAVRLRVSERARAWLRNARVVHEEGELLRMEFESEEAAVRALLAYGAEVEVVQPPALRALLVSEAQRLVQLYAP